MGCQVHLIDGTYELFRAYFGAPPARAPDGQEVGAARGLARSLIRLVAREKATHVGIAFDHEIRSFRNDLFAGYKTGEGIEPELLAQFPLAEEIASALGFVVWPLVEFEADDGLAAGAAKYYADDRVTKVLICSPDKDLAQCVQGDWIVCVDRRREKEMDEDGVVEKFGVNPESMPDWLALVGDSADGIPGVPRWGAKSASTVLASYEKIENIPPDPADWNVKPRGAAALAANLSEHRDAAELYRRLATLRTDVPLDETLDELEWRGADHPRLAALCERIGDDSLIDRVPRWR